MGGEPEHEGPSPARTPNLFLVGVQRSATTALWSYLGQHPDILMAPKELHYFGSDLGMPDDAANDAARISVEDYLSCFAQATGERYRGDASVGYLPSRRAAAEIRGFSPDARIVASFRNPVDMAYSLYSLLRFQGVETSPSFTEALHDDAPRGALTPGPFRWAFTYRDLLRYAEQLERFLSAFGRDRVHVVIYEEFIADVAGTYRGVLDFLGVDPTFRPEFPVVNANRKLRSERLRRWVTHPPPALRRVGRMMVPSRAGRRRVGGRLLDFSQPEVDRIRLDEVTLRRLDDEVAEEVAHLGDLLGRDLASLWARPRAGAAR